MQHFAAKRNTMRKSYSVRLHLTTDEGAEIKRICADEERSQSKVLSRLVRSGLLQRQAAQHQTQRVIELTQMLKAPACGWEKLDGRRRSRAWVDVLRNRWRFLRRRKSDGRGQASAAAGAADCGGLSIWQTRACCPEKELFKNLVIGFYFVDRESV